ncbi:MAG TPA: NFACT family protein [Anaerolineae bacterium]|nr:NFACT family protein [Anaerolineae bacterium]
MYFDALTMSCVAGELRRAVVGGRVQQVVLPDDLTVGFEIYANHQRHYLLASAHAEQGRLHLSSEKLRRGADRETGLLLLLRKYARGALLAQVEQPPSERIARLEFDHPEWGCTDLMVEVMGRHSNVILVDPDGRVLDAVKRVRPDMSSVRPILPGTQYEPPPPQDKLPPGEVTEYRLRQLLSEAEPGEHLWRVLVRGLLGISPLLAREIVFRALGRPRARAGDVERITPLLQAIGELLAPLETGAWQPSLSLEEGVPGAYAPYLLTHRGEVRPVPSISHAIETYTAAIATADPYTAAKRPVRQAIERARERLARRRASLQRSLEEVGEAARWREWGEWLLAYAHTVEPHQEELVADTGEATLRIPLDPALSAVDNAQAYFERYRKAQRAAAEVPAQLQQVALAEQDLDQLAADLALAASRPEIEDVKEALVDAGHVPAGKRKRKSGVPRSHPLSLLLPGGVRVWIGRNSRQNDEVTFGRGTSDDWWFHARGIPGAHVIARAPTGELPPDAAERAAELAAYFSQHRGEPYVEVDYTRRRHVRRIPGAAPGLVTYGEERTLRVVPRGPLPAEQAA